MLTKPTTTSLNNESKHNDSKNREAFKEILDITGGFIAGGALRDLLDNREPRDIDIFFNNKEEMLECLDKLKKNPNFCLKYSNDNCIGYIYVSKNHGVFNVEIIKRRFGTPGEVVDGFDIFLSQMYFHKSETEYELVITQDAETGWLLKEIKINKFSNPLGTLKRVIKYSRYGYQIPSKELRKLIYKVFISLIIPFITFRLKKHINKSLTSYYGK